MTKISAATLLADVNAATFVPVARDAGAGTFSDGRVKLGKLALLDGEWSYIKLAANFLNTTLLDNATLLAMGTLLPNTHYVFEGMFFVQTIVATTGPRPGLSWPGGLTANAARLITPNSASADATRHFGGVTTQNASGTGLPIADVTHLANTFGMFITGAAPTGTLTITLASEIDLSEVRMMAGSFLRWRALP